MRRLLTTLVVLAAVLLAVDRGGAYAASRVLASRLQDQQHLAQRPGVAVRGFPFLTQVLRGRYDEVDATATGVDAKGLRVQQVRLVAQGVRVALSDALHGRVRSVPVDRATAVVTVGYADLDAYLAAHTDGITSVRYDGPGRVRVAARLSALGVTVTPSVDASVSASDDTLRLVPLAAELARLPLAVQEVGRRVLTVSLPIGGLPFGLHLRSGDVTAAGVVLDAEATGAVFSTTGG